MNRPVIGCEKLRTNGSQCGIVALGRCVTCGEAFCISHQANDSVGTRYAAWCLTCQQKQWEANQKRYREIEASRQYFLSGTARADLLKVGVPSVEMYEVYSCEKTRWTLLGQRHEWVDEVNLFGRGWLLGEFTWSCRFPVSVGKDNGKYSRVLYNGDSNTVNKEWLTALMDISPPDLNRIVHSTNSQHATRNSTLVRVRPYSGSYQVLFALDDNFGGALPDWWCEVEKAVKQLI